MSNPSSDKEWSHKARMAAIFVYALTGSFEWAENISGVPASAIREWQQNDPDGFGELCKESLAHMTDADRDRIRQFQEMGLAIVKDRLDNGDYQLNADTGQVERVPLSADDTAEIIRNVGNALGIQPGAANKH